MANTSRQALVKPGRKTTEFAVTLVTMGLSWVGLLMLWTGRISPPDPELVQGVLLGAANLSPATYIAGRSWVKGSAARNGA